MATYEHTGVRTARTGGRALLSSNSAWVRIVLIAAPPRRLKNQIWKIQYTSKWTIANTWDILVKDNLQTMHIRNSVQSAQGSEVILGTHL
jgi:hypothetical protein